VGPPREARPLRVELTGDVVRAAGGLVIRHGGEEAEVLLVHRPAYDDWSFPKGKANAGETDEACALREVEEETGLSCAIVRPLREVSYRDAKGRPKTVRYFAMRPLDGTFEPHEEIDAARWLRIDEALSLLSYGRDRALLRELAGGG